MSSSDSEDEEQDNVEILLDNGGAFLAGGKVSGLVRVTRLEATECSRLELKASGALTLQWAKLVTHHKCNNRGKVLSKAYSSGSASHREKLMEVEMNLLEGGKKKENKEEEEKKEEEKEEDEGQEEEEEEEKEDEEGDGDDDKEEGEGKADDGDGEDEEEDKEEEKEDEEHEQEEEKEEEKEEENDDNRTFVVPKGVTDYEFEIPLKEDLLPTFFSREGEADAHALVQYLLTAKLVPTGDPDVEAAPTRFSVTPAVALDSMEAPIPPSAPAQERRKFPGACSCLGGEVQANALLQKRAFVSGEAANVAISVRNGSNRRVVVSAYLGRRMTWTMKEMEQRVENRFHLGATPDQAMLTPANPLGTLGPGQALNMTAPVPIPPMAPSAISTRTKHIVDTVAVVIKFEVEVKEPFIGDNQGVEHEFRMMLPVVVGNVPHQAECGAFERDPPQPQPTEGKVTEVRNPIKNLDEASSRFGLPGVNWMEDPLKSGGKFPVYKLNASAIPPRPQPVVMQQPQMLVVQQPRPVMVVQQQPVLVMHHQQQQPQQAVALPGAVN